VTGKVIRFMPLVTEAGNVPPSTLTIFRSCFCRQHFVATDVHKIAAQDPVVVFIRK